MLALEADDVKKGLAFLFGIKENYILDHGCIETIHGPASSIDFAVKTMVIKLKEGTVLV